ncbi:putative carbonic anhydrase [Dioscorea sansibarensis]
MGSSTLLHLFLLSFVLFSCFPNAKPQAEEGFSYIEGSPNRSEYREKLKPEWKTCSNSINQSLIDLPDDIVIQNPTLGKLRTSYQAARATLKNTGHDVMVRILI